MTQAYDAIIATITTAPEPPLERKVELLWDAHPELHGEL